jgi:hypothetical protein
MLEGLERNTDSRIELALAELHNSATSLKQLGIEDKLRVDLYLRGALELLHKTQLADTAVTELAMPAPRAVTIPTPEELQLGDDREAEKIAGVVFRKFNNGRNQSTFGGPLKESDFGSGAIRKKVEAILARSGWKPQECNDGRETFGWTLIADKRAHSSKT